MTENPQANSVVQDYLQNKERFMKVVITLTSLTAFSYGITHYFLGKRIVGAVDLLMSAFLAGLYVVKNRVHFESRVTCLSAIMLAFLSFILIDGATGDVGFLWMMLFPSIIFYLSGVRRGVMWMIVGQFTLVGLAVAYLLGWIQLPYQKIVMLQINVCYFVLAVLTYFAEKDRLVRTHGLLDAQKQEETSKQILNQKLTELEKLNKVMDANESLSQAQKISLEDTKRAMINLLDDARELEEELKTEKAGVEQKIIERTQELQAKTSALEKAREETTKGWLQLQAEKAKLNASVEAIPVGLVMIDTQHQILIGNSAFKKIAGLDDDTTLIDQALFEAFLTGLNLDFQKTCAHCMKENSPYLGSDLYFKERILKILAVPVYQEKILIGTAYLVEDETDAKRLQTTRDEFFSVASHELRTPLTAIRGNSQMLQDYYPEVMKNEEVKAMVVDIHDASIRLIQIVNDFLDASRLELKKVEMKIEKLSLKEVIEKSMAEINPESVGKKLEYSLKVSAEREVFVMGDRSRLLQVIINLLGNAMKFTQVGGVYVDVEAEESLRIARVKVSDTGGGMTREDQSQLFQKFKQVGSNAGLARETSQGSGMGLYISKLIMESMGGKVYLDWSEKGKGSRFAVELPLA
jgi:signal transduction histidine kinase